MIRTVLVVATTLLSLASAAPLAGECASICNDLKTSVLTLAMCRDAKKVLPRPKVGDFCSIAMEQGFSDACIPMCMGEQPVQRIAQACRAAAMEMPRPTVRKWCEHGYRQGFTSTSTDLRSHFEVTASSDATGQSGEVSEEAHLEEAQKMEERRLLNTFPITLDDTVLNLNVYEGQSAEDAVAEFCHMHMNDDPSGCIRQLLPVVLERAEGQAEAEN